MSADATLIAATTIAVALGLLDLAERGATRASRGDGAPLAIRSVAFLIVVILVYGALQVAGMALVPDAEGMIATADRLLGGALGRPAQPARLGPLGATVVCVAGFYVSGLWDYLFHRFVSHGRWLFFTHEYHHLTTQVFVLAPGIVVRPFVVVTVLPTATATVATLALGLAALGYSPLVLVALAPTVLLLQFVVLIASHSSFLRRFWWIHLVLSRLGVTTPHEHLLHHTVAMSRNFANFATLWDRVFGSYAAPARNGEATLALGLPYDCDFLGAITGGRLQLPASVRERFQVGRYCNVGGPGRTSEKRPRTADRGQLEHFPTTWMPVRRRKREQIEEEEPPT